MCNDLSINANVILTDLLFSSPSLPLFNFLASALTNTSDPADLNSYGKVQLTMHKLAFFAKSAPTLQIELAN